MANPKEKPADVTLEEHALAMFKGMGYDPANLPASLVRYYSAFKRKKDILQPGRLSAEGFAFVAILSELTEGNLEAPKKGDA